MKTWHKNKHLGFSLIGGLIIASTCFGCATKDAATSITKIEAQDQSTENFVLKEGDVIHISFPGSPSLDNTQTIRVDGKVSLQIVGEVKAAGLSPKQLESKLLELYANQLTTKEILVSVQNSSFPVFVTGSVLHPGKIMVDHPMSPLEVIMEAGGFDYSWADLKKVVLIRKENGKTERYPLNLKDEMNGKSVAELQVRPSDIIYVPQKIF